jgi:transposase
LRVDPKTLPQDAETLKKMLVDVTAQLDRTERLLRQLLEAKTGRKSEQLSREQLALFAQEAGLALPEPEQTTEYDEEPPAGPSSLGTGVPRGRKPLPRHLKRERIEHDLPNQEKHCAECDQDLRKIGEEVSERYEYPPAQMKVIEDACFTYACDCTVKTASKPPQPIEKGTAGASRSIRNKASMRVTMAIAAPSCEFISPRRRTCAARAPYLEIWIRLSWV